MNVFGSEYAHSVLYGLSNILLLKLAISKFRLGMSIEKKH